MNPKVHKIHITKYTEVGKAEGIGIPDRFECNIIFGKETEDLLLLEDRALYNEYRINVSNDVHPDVRKMLLKLVYKCARVFT